MWIAMWQQPQKVLSDGGSNSKKCSVMQREANKTNWWRHIKCRHSQSILLTDAQLKKLTEARNPQWLKEKRGKDKEYEEDEIQNQGEQYSCSLLETIWYAVCRMRYEKRRDKEDEDEEICKGRTGIVWSSRNSYHDMQCTMTKKDVFEKALI